MKVITIGKRLVSSEQLALIEPFDPASNPEFKTEKEFKGRVVLIDRDMILTEETPVAFAEAHGLCLLTDDHVALNASVAFKVEIFEPTDSFKPGRAYKTRIKWRDLAGHEQSKLLLTEPEAVITALAGEKTESKASASVPARRPARGRSGSRRMDAFRS